MREKHKKGYTILKSILKYPCESNVVERRENVNIYEENNRLIHYYLQSNRYF